MAVWYSKYMKEGKKVLLKGNSGQKIERDKVRELSRERKT
jgi:hypothetical protein